MTDLEKLRKTFDDLGIKYEVITAIEDRKMDVYTDEANGITVAYDTRIKITEGIGYDGFYCDFLFWDGKYQGHGIW